MDNTTALKLINETILCVLKYDKTKNSVFIDYINIPDSFQSEFHAFAKICQNDAETLGDIITFLSIDKGLEGLAGYYSYCVDIRGAYQGVAVYKADKLSEQIEQHHQTLLLNKKLNPEKYNLVDAVSNYKLQLLSQYGLWIKASSIQKAYEICKQDENVLAFSHRLCGWSNPVHQLTKIFSVELKTNFGYGSVTYFYSKLKFKNIEITPFSAWIEYEQSYFSDIIRYTRKHFPSNEEWLEAMTFCQDACNLSLSDEKKFVEVYIIDECEKMVAGLEAVLSKDSFEFKRWNGKPYRVDKKERTLLEYRGEKLSGALDFIAKILVLSSVFDVTNIVARIEACNKSIQPILEREIPIIENELSALVAKISVLKPKFLLLQKEDKSYDSKREKMLAKMEANNKAVSSEEFELKFKEKYPLYESFLEEFQSVSREYSTASQLFENTKKIHGSISGYNKKIVSFLWGKK